MQSRLLKILLERLCCETYIASTVVEAVDKITNVLFDIIIVDGFSFREVNTPGHSLRSYRLSGILFRIIALR